MIGIGLGSMLVLLLLPLFLPRQRGPHDLGRAVSNARQLGLALFEFDTEYGKFPDSSTVTAVRRNTGSTLTLPDHTSNDLFAQLIASGIVTTEHMFYAKAKFMRRPDDVITTDATVLAHGECAFAYISGLSTADDPSAPLAFGPVIPGTSTLDRKSCEGRAVVLKIDNSAANYPINSAGKIIVNGLDILDPRQSFWRGKAPAVKWPK